MLHERKCSRRRRDVNFDDSEGAGDPGTQEEHSQMNGQMNTVVKDTCQLWKRRNAG
jgi:hypothetical protein